MSSVTGHSDKCSASDRDVYTATADARNLMIATNRWLGQLHPVPWRLEAWKSALQAGAKLW